MIKRLLAFGFFLLCCGAFVLYYWNGGLIAHSASDMLASANTFLQDIGAGRIDNAYSSTSLSFRKDHSPEQFRELINRYPLLKAPSTRALRDYSIKRTLIRGTAQYAAALQAAKESLPVKLTLVTEEARWKVDGLTVESK